MRHEQHSDCSRFGTLCPFGLCYLSSNLVHRLVITFMTDKIKALVQQAGFGYRLTYQEPIFDLEKLDTVAVGAVFEALRPWNISLEQVVFKDEAANLAEEAITFNLFGGRITFVLNPGGCGLGVGNPSWSEAGLITQIASAAVGAALRATGAKRGKQLGSITMHLTPHAGIIRDITSKFVKLDLDKLTGAPAHNFGFSVYQDDLLWVVDKSAMFEKSLFVRMDRTVQPEAPFEQLAQKLNEDENKLLDLLGLEVN
jgi:hypothetical protein